MDLQGNTSYQCSYSCEPPSETKYYKNFLVEDCIKLCEANENVSAIISIKSNVVAESVELCDKLVKVKCSTGLKCCALLIIKLKMSFQIKYVGGVDNKSVYVDSSNFYKTLYVPVPEMIDLCNIKDYYRKNRINVQIYVEDLQTNTLDQNTVKFSLIGFANILFI